MAQRSFRIADDTLRLLDDRATELGMSRNALAQQVLDQGLKALRHPLIHYRLGAAGDRRAALLGHRIYVWQLMETFRGEGNSVDATAEYFRLDPEFVRAAVGFYAEFPEEIDADARREQEFADREQERWRREQALLA